MAQTTLNEPAGNWVSDGVIWEEPTPPTLSQLALRAAPVLWFSPHEFLLKQPVPLAIPGSLEPPRMKSQLSCPDGRKQEEVLYPTERAVYFRVVEVERASADEWRSRMASASSQVTSDAGQISIRYMFYYPKDCGFGGYTHDLEVIDVRLSIKVEGDNTVARVENVAGAAHGVGWYTNELNVAKADRVLFPLRVFVEENKHASAPDRDGDGRFDPYSDINDYPIDSWGVRDVQPHNFRLASGYRSEMTRTRTSATQVWPAGHPTTPSTATTYRLIHSLSSAICDKRTSDAGESVLAGESLDGIPNSSLLAGFLADKGFCRGPQTPPFSRGLPAGLGGTVFRPFGMAMERVSVGFRLDGNRPGWAWNIPFLRLPRLDGWVGARLNFLFERRQAIRRMQFDETALRDLLETEGNAVQFDIFYMRSAGRLLDWYASGGIDQRSIRETVVGNIVDVETRPGFEGGIRVRFPMPDLMKRSLHLPFWGVRVGGRRSFNHTTFVVEAGLGAW